VGVLRKTGGRFDVVRVIVFSEQPEKRDVREVRGIEVFGGGVGRGV
jgi:hypothetical protein